MANLFGATPPIIYVGNTAYQLPFSDRAGREEDFKKRLKVWRDLDNVLRKRVKGYELQCTYRWQNTEVKAASDTSTVGIDELTTILNSEEQIYIKFSTLPTRYPVYIPDDGFKHGLADGLNDADAVELNLVGTTWIKAYPNPDLIYFMPPIYRFGAMVRTLEEQAA